VIRQLAPERPAAQPYAPDAPSPTGLVAAAAAVRAVAVAASGLLLTAGLALVLWAVTPSSGADVGIALQSGVVAFAAANLMPVVIGGITLSLPPLLLTLTMAVLLAATARRGRFLPQGRYQEAVSILVTTVVYGIVVAAVARGLGPQGAVPAGWVWTAPALALVATATGMLRPGSAWHEWWIVVAPDWARVGVRGGGIGLGVLIAGGGIALSVGLVTQFGSAVGVAALAAPSWLDGLGLAMLGMAYVPNAVIAAAGYVTGVGFEMGAGTYSPFGTTTVDLPAVPLLAAAPDQAGRSWVGLVFLVVPVIAGYLIARPAIKHLVTRSDRVLASAVGAALTGGLLAGVAAIARGGIGDGRWSTFGAPPALLGAVVAVEVGAIAMAIAGLAGGRSVPWRLSSPVRADEPVEPPRSSRKAGMRKARTRQDRPTNPPVADLETAEADGAATGADLAEEEIGAEEIEAADAMQAEDETEVVTQDEIEAVTEDDAGTDADAEDDAGSDDTTRHTET
jgi:hypothetical protein